MKVACSSESFAAEFETARFTQLEWLDVCANELEVDGVVFAAAHFPRTDGEYVAQLKKTATDLGLTIAALSYDANVWFADESPFELATVLGAPMIVAPAAAREDDTAAWGSFTAAVSAKARAAKAHNIPLAVRNGPGTLCPAASDLRRLSKDVDSSWLRYALDVSTDDADAPSLLGKAIIAVARLDDVAAPERLARFRGFTLLEAAAPALARTSYHEALDRFRRQRLKTLAT